MCLTLGGEKIKKELLHNIKSLEKYEVLQYRHIENISTKFGRGKHMGGKKGKQSNNISSKLPPTNRKHL